MNKSKQHHVVPNSNGGWDVKKANSSRASGNFGTKVEAVSAARSISRNQHTELVIHGKDGKIQQSDSHGNDPCPPKDKN